MTTGNGTPRERVLARMRRAVARGTFAGGLGAVGIGCVDAAPVPSCTEQPPDQHGYGQAGWLSVDGGPVFLRFTVNTFAFNEDFSTAVTAVGADVGAVQRSGGDPNRGTQAQLDVDLVPGPGVRFIDVDVAATCGGTAETLRWRLDVTAGVGATVTVTSR